MKQELKLLLELLTLPFLSFILIFVGIKEQQRYENKGEIKLENG